MAISILTGILFGLAPALQGSASSLTAVLNEGGRSGTAGRAGRRMRNALVVTEVALAMIVLIGAGLLIRSFVRLRSVDPGFQPAGVLTARVPLSGGRNNARERRVVFLEQLTARVATLPGVRAVAAVNGLPLTTLGAGSTPSRWRGAPRPARGSVPWHSGAR